MITDPIADFLTCIRNALKARHAVLSVKNSYMKRCIAKILQEQGYIESYSVDEKQGLQGTINIVLKYHPITKEPAIVMIKRISKPGRRQYTRKDALPHVANSLGIAIISTSKGVLTDKAARTQGVGGEEICHVF